MARKHLATEGFFSFDPFPEDNRIAITNLCFVQHKRDCPSRYIVIKRTLNGKSAALGLNSGLLSLFSQSWYLCYTETSLGEDDRVVTSIKVIAKDETVPEGYSRVDIPTNHPNLPVLSTLCFERLSISTTPLAIANIQLIRASRFLPAELPKNLVNAGRFKNFYILYDLFPLNHARANENQRALFPQIPLKAKLTSTKTPVSWICEVENETVLEEVLSGEDRGGDPDRSMPKRKPITKICILNDSEDIPTGFIPLHEPSSQKAVIFSWLFNTQQCICYTRDDVAQGYITLLEECGNEPHNRIICYKLVPKTDTSKAVVDIKLIRTNISKVEGDYVNVGQIGDYDLIYVTDDVGNISIAEHSISSNSELSEFIHLITQSEHTINAARRWLSATKSYMRHNTALDEMRTAQPISTDGIDIEGRTTVSDSSEGRSGEYDQQVHRETGNICAPAGELGGALRGTAAETCTEVIGVSGKTIEVGRCSVLFQVGCFLEPQEVTVKAEIDPSNWPPNRIAITPTLYVHATNLMQDAIINLHTWCSDDGEGQRVEIWQHTKKDDRWEMIKTCSLGHSRLIEFQVSHFCSYVAAIWNFFGFKCIIKPLVYYSAKDFVVALVRDTELSRNRLTKDMEITLGKDMQQKILAALECKPTDHVKTVISCDPNKDFVFYVSNDFTHSINSVMWTSGPSYGSHSLTSRLPSQEIRIVVDFIKHEKSLMKYSFTYNWIQTDSTKIENRTEIDEPNSSAQTDEAPSPRPTIINVNIHQQQHVDSSESKSVGTENVGGTVNQASYDSPAFIASAHQK